ncbi:hypothetical protein HDV05_005147 [Chytridiales sp. JEL 0842]|nr:hypothetical protein HDV05_005147 [Chytridiales sp. JEL 0842]
MKRIAFAKAIAANNCTFTVKGVNASMALAKASKFCPSPSSNGTLESCASLTQIYLETRLACYEAGKWDEVNKCLCNDALPKAENE